MPIATKRGMVVNFHAEPPPIKSHHPFITQSSEIIGQLEPVIIKLGRIVSFLEGIQAIESHEPLITWSCELI